MNRVILYSAVILTVVHVVVGFADGGCGTHHPVPLPMLEGRVQQGGCWIHDCDDPITRDQFLLNRASEILTVRINVIYFGDLSGDNGTNYNEQIAFFAKEFLDFAGVSLNITTRNVVDGPYQAVDAELRDFHRQIANQYYEAGAMTVLITTFDPNPRFLLGYAAGFPQTFDLSSPQDWYTIVERASIGPKGTTLLHEVGHMFGLFHTFSTISDDACPYSCREEVLTEDRNTVGDFCNDTLPVSVSYTCDSLSSDVDCQGSAFGPLNTLPQNNYMAYTPDSCQDEFTPQQGARVRCYITQKLDFLLVTDSASPTSAPALAGGPSSSPTRGQPIRNPSPQVVSEAATTNAIQFVSTVTIAVIATMW